MFDAQRENAASPRWTKRKQQSAQTRHVANRKLQTEEALFPRESLKRNQVQSGVRRKDDAAFVSHSCANGLGKQERSQAAQRWFYSVRVLDNRLNSICEFVEVGHLCFRQNDTLYIEPVTVGNNRKEYASRCSR